MRIEELVNLVELEKFKNSMEFMIKDLYEEGFELVDINSYLLNQFFKVMEVSEKDL